jgi:hypothetical protein
MLVGKRSRVIARLERLYCKVCKGVCPGGVTVVVKQVKGSPGCGQRLRPQKAKIYIHTVSVVGHGNLVCLRGRARTAVARFTGFK